VSAPITRAYVLEVIREGRKGQSRRDEHWLADRALEMADCLSDLDGNGLIELLDDGIHAPCALPDDD
jgi:hypothetical protein